MAMAATATRRKKPAMQATKKMEKAKKPRQQKRPRTKTRQDLDVDHDNGDESFTDQGDSDFEEPVKITKKKRRHVKPNSNQTDPFVEVAETKARRKRSSSKAGDKKNETEEQEQEAEEEEDASSNVETMSASDMKPSVIEIPRPKGSPFSDAISPDILQFLSELKENNNRDFMRINQERWQSLRKEFMDFVGMISTQLHELDPTIMVEEPKHAIYRQNRDLRFTNDLRPYKTHLSASFSRGGKKSPFAGYHISIAPGNETFVAAGIWQPASPRLARIRQGIMDNASLMHEALSIPAMDEVFGKHGLEVLEDTDKLKTAPKNVPKDHPEIELLRYKSMVISKTFTDLEVVSEGFLDTVLDTFEAVVPFVAVLNSWTG